MDERKNKYRDPNEIYGTGSTQPPKDHGGKISVILMVGIFFCGMISALGLMKIRLFTLNAAAEDPTVFIAFHGTGSPAAPSTSRTDAVPGETEAVFSEPVRLGIAGERISRFYQRFYHWPAGLYITHVDAGSDAEKNNIAEGDILVSVNGIAADDLSAVQKTLQACQIGDRVALVIYRNSRLFSVNFVLSGTDP